uniref:ABC transporter ATP-binding protein n=1 Tax=Ensifer aridi TaxID=1708715 RepID=UPI001AED0916
EPLGALDKRLREQMQLELRQIHKRLGVTMIFVTHDQSEALTMADRVAVFDDGRIQQIASPMRLYDEPETAFVAAFVGENNQLPAKVVQSEGELCEVLLHDGSRGRGISTRQLNPESNAMMVIRPERISVSPTGDYSNKYVGRVREVIELGDQTRLKLGIAGNVELLIKLPRTAGDCVFQAGQEVSVGWKSKDCRVLAA